ncbi:MAG: hypothetical protein PHW69_00045 [Elusimicrobiaceae bacterium]|nr:hypothetical protein [Elusimicrobiaceae bacterium]
MFSKTELDKFIELQAQDRRIARTLERFVEIPRDIAALETEFRQRTAIFESKKARYKKLLVTRKELEGELAAAEKLIEKHQQELNLIKSNDAFKALLSEIELQKTKKSDIETAVLQCLESIEAEEKIQEPIRLDHEEDAEQTKKAIAALAAEKDNLSKLTDGLKTARELFARTITDRALFEKYENLLKRRDGIALSLAKRRPNGVMICTQCNMTLLPHQANEVESGEKPVFCESCTRILYAVRAEPEPA